MAGTVQGNAAAINGLPLGTTQPNLSTRTAFQTVAGLNNSPLSVTGPATGATVNNGVVLDGPGKYAASLNISSTATSDVGVLVNGFSGSSAIAGGNVIGAFNSDTSLPGGVVNPTNPSARGDLFFSANGTGASAATTYTGVDPSATSAAAVVDIAGSGIFNSEVRITPGTVGNVFFTSNLNGASSATGTTVGKVTAPGAGPVSNPAVTAGVATDPLDGTGVNSILNLNSRGINGLDQYFNDPISPFFAEFSGLVPGPTSSDSVSSPSGVGVDLVRATSINAQATANGSSTASNVTGDTNAFSGIFSSGALLRGGYALYEGNVNFTSALGLGTPVETSSTTSTGSSSAISNLLSVGGGTAAVRGNATGPSAPPAIVYQSTSAGTLTGAAFSAANTTAQSTTGDVVAFTGGLLGSGGNTFANDFNPGNTLTIGLFNLNFNPTGTASGNIVGSAEVDTNTTASTTTGNAKAANTGITGGIFGADLSGMGPVNNILNRVDGNISGIASAMSDVAANTRTGTSLATNFQTVAGIANYDVTITGTGGAGGTASLVSSSVATSN